MNYNWLAYLYFYSILGGLVLLTGTTEAQSYMPSYFFEKDEVIFEFDIRDYKTASVSGRKKRLDFEDLDIYEVAISGNFNNWSKDAWKMQRVDENKFQLRKKIGEFNDKFKWKFKYVINGVYLADPKELNYQRAKVQHNNFWEEVFDLKLYSYEVDPNGNAIFSLAGFQNAKKVILAGDFNGWDERNTKMQKVDGGWALTLKLQPGKYEYKFIVDGEWMHDPINSKTVVNVHGTLNSILFVSKAITFKLKNYLQAEKVILAGSFNDWDTENYRMQKRADGWYFTIDLVGGKHYYKFIVDGEWMVDPENPWQEWDGEGNINSAILIQ